MATTTRTRNTAAKPAAKPAATKPAAKPEVTEPTSLSERAAKAKTTREESKASGETRTCAGECGETKPINKFPTTTRNKDGEMGRAKVCRACRDKARADVKAGK